MADLIHRTALDLPAEEWKNYQPLSGILKHRSASQGNLSNRRKRAARLAKKAAAMLHKDFGARRVVLFGSLASRGSFTQWSDIDLAVWGVASDRFYAAVAAITGLSAEFKIDLVDAETSKQSLQDIIEKSGIAL